MKAIVTTALLALTTSLVAAAPSPSSPPPPSIRPSPHALCSAGGAKLFAIDVTPTSGADARLTSHTTIFANRQWTHTWTDAAGARLDSGCFTAEQMATVDADLAHAPWKITRDDVTCAAIGESMTSYALRGKHVFTAAVCSGEHLDDVSQHAITEIEKLLNTSSTVGG